MTLRRLAVAAALLTGLGLVAVGTILQYDHEATGDRSATGALSDYRDALYQPVRALADGVNPYDHVAYLDTGRVDQELPPYFPINFLPFAPLALLPLALAGGLFVAASIAAVLAAGWVLAGRSATAVADEVPADAAPASASAATGGNAPLAAIGPSPRGGRAIVAAGFAAAVMLSRPGFQALQYGQVAPWVALCLALAVRGWRRDRWWLVAVGVTAAWAKPSFGLPAALLLLAAGEGRAVRWGTALAWLSWLPVGLLLLRFDGPVELVKTMLEDLSFSAEHPYGRLMSGTRVDLPASLAKLLGWHMPSAVELGIGLAVVVVSGLAVRREPRPSRRLLLVVLGSLLAMWRQPYDLVLVAVPLGAVWLDAAAEGRFSGGPRRWVHEPAMHLMVLFLPAALSWGFGQRGADVLGLGPAAASRWSTGTGFAAAACWCYAVAAPFLAGPVDDQRSWPTARQAPTSIGASLQ